VRQSYSKQNVGRFLRHGVGIMDLLSEVGTSKVGCNVEGMFVNILAYAGEHQQSCPHKSRLLCSYGTLLAWAAVLFYSVLFS